MMTWTFLSKPSGHRIASYQLALLDIFRQVVPENAQPVCKLIKWLSIQCTQ